jgi:hypothetical protein
MVKQDRKEGRIALASLIFALYDDAIGSTATLKECQMEMWFPKLSYTNCTTSNAETPSVV